jgi:predicted MFS family arabinose efflux permease
MLAFDTGEGALRFLMPVFVRELGQPYTIVGTMTAVFGIATLLTRLPTGLAYRAHRARRLLIVAGLACSLSFMLLAFTSSLPLVGLLIAIDGIGWGVVTTVLLSLMLANRPPRTTPAAAMGWFVGINGLGHALAALIGGVLADAIGIRAAFLALGAVPLIATVLMGRVLARQVSVEDSTPADAPAPPVRPTRRVPQVRLAALGDGLRRSVRVPTVVWTAAFVSFYANTMNSLLVSFFPLLALTLGMSLSQAGALSAIRSGTSALTRFAAIPVIERVGERRLRTPTMIASAAATTAVSLTPVFLLQAPIWALNGLFRGVLRVGTSAEAMSAVSDEDSGPTAALLSGGLDLGKIVGPLVAGAVADAVGVAGMFRVLPLGFLVVFLMLGALEGRRRRTSISDRDPGTEGPQP